MYSHLPRAPPTTALATTLTVALLTLSSAPAAAYETQLGGYAGGGDAFTLRFGLGTTELAGAALRLLTNSTVVSGSVLVEGQVDFANRSYDETTTGDFLSNTLLSDMSVGSGSLLLNAHSDTITLNAANNFRNATLSGMTFAAGKLVLNGGSSGNFTSEALSAPAAGWGVLTAQAALPPGASLTFDILAPNGTVLISGQPWGSYIDLEGDDYPSIRVHGEVSGGDANFALSWVMVGQQAGDHMSGGGVTRTFSELYNLSATVGGLTLRHDYLRFANYSVNPLINRSNGSFFDNGPMQPEVVQAGSQWWMYFSSNDSHSGGAQIGRAVSDDLINWTVDPAPVLSGDAGAWDESAVYWPRVVKDPFTSDWVMYYTGMSGSNGARIGRATSTDGVNWTKFWNNPVLAPGSSGWDSYTVGPVADVNFSSGTYTMWYSGNDTDPSGPWPFRGSSLGVATSTDGTNWTRYTGNPVLTRGGGNDSYDMRAGRITSINGTMFYYYSCRQANQLYRVCGASSPDGYNWTKEGIMLDPAGPAGAWNHEIQDPTVVLVNGTVTMFYDGANASSSSIGRADSGWVNGTYTGMVDMGNRFPLQWLRVNLDADWPAGSSYLLQVLVSSDGSSWSTPENLTSGASITTSASNYLQWNVTLRGGFGQPAPVLRGVDIPCSAYASFGDYRSDTQPFAEPAVSAGASLYDASPGAGTVDISISTDNGSTWVPINNASLNPVNNTPSSLRYALHVQGTEHSTPYIDAVSILYETAGFPADVTLRLDTNSTPFFTHAGPLNSRLNASLPVAQLNAAIDAAKAQFPGQPTTDVTLLVTTSHYGKVVVSEPRVNISLKNPIYATFTPPAMSLQVDENTTNLFAVNATSYPPFVPVNITWYFDGVVVPSNTGRFNYTYSPDYNAAGSHTLFATMENGDTVLNKTWTVVVRNVNRVPYFTSLTPSGSVTMNHRQTADFTAAAADPDGQNVTLAWAVDGITRGTGSNFTAGPLLPGTHNVRVTASDGADQVSFLWLVNSTNAGPQITGSDPAGPLSITNHDTLTFSVTVTDLEGDPITYKWSIDNGATLPDNTSSILAGPFSVGTHILVVDVSDGHSTDRHVFNITATNTPPVILTVKPVGDFTVTHLAQPVLSVVAFDAENDALQYEWRDNNVPIAIGTNTTTLTALTVGVHNITVFLNDAFSQKYYTWNITVTDAPPVLTQANPKQGQVNVSIDVDQSFSTTVLDPDGDSIDREWYVDGALDANVTGSTYRKRWSEAGTHVVHFEASANGKNVSAEWTVVVALINVPAVITSTDPDATSVDVEFDHAQIFKITITDDRAVTTRIVWKLDGAQVGLGDTYQLHATSEMEGQHTLVAEVQDGAFNTSTTWTVTVKAPAAPPPKSPGFEGALALAAIAAAAAAVAAVSRRKRHD